LNKAYLPPRQFNRWSACYHPLFVFNQFGDLERCALRAGNVHSADGWDDVLKPVVARYQGKVSRIYFRADAAFAMPEVYEFLDAERIKYAIRLPANQVLQSRIGYLLTRPVGRPPRHVRRFHANFSYQAWTKPRRVTAKVEWHPGELYPRVGFIVTNMSRPAESREPRPLCYLPDGRGHHRTANVPRDFAADRGATAAATTSASVRHSMSCIQEQPTEGVRPNAREMARSDLRPSVRVPRVGNGQHLASVLQEGRENANIDAGLGFIWRISGKIGLQ
jgi:hypothetical protein